MNEYETILKDIKYDINKEWDDKIMRNETRNYFMR